MENSKQINRKATYYRYPVYDYCYDIEILFNIDPAYEGRDFYLSCDIVTTGGEAAELSYNGGSIDTGTLIDFDDTLISDVSWIKLYGHQWFTSFDSYIKYFKLVEVSDANVPATLNFTADIQEFDKDLEDTSNIFKAEVYFKFYTNISQNIKLDIYNFDTSSYENIISVTHTSNTLEMYSIEVDYILNYTDDNDKFRIKIYGDNEENDFELYVDYLAIKIFYIP